MFMKSKNFLIYFLKKAGISTSSIFITLSTQSKENAETKPERMLAVACINQLGKIDPPAFFSLTKPR